MKTITTQSHPHLTPAERRSARAALNASDYRLVRSEVRLRRKSDGKQGKIEFVLVYPPSGADAYTVRLRRNGDPCRCSCMDYARRLERDGAAVEPCKHMLMVSGQGQAPEPPKPAFDIEAEAARLARLEAAERESRELWPAD